MSSLNEDVSKYKGLLSTLRPSEPPAARPPSPSVVVDSTPASAGRAPSKHLLGIIEVDVGLNGNGASHNKPPPSHLNGNGCPQPNNNNKAATRKRLAVNPLLSELLTDTTPTLLPYVLQFDQHDCTYPDEYNKVIAKTRMDDHHLKMAKLAINDLDPHGKPSRLFSDYFVVSFESTRHLEQAGSDNSLFLLMARAILYRLNFIDENYASFLRCQLFHGLISDDYRFDSDMSLQELVRKRLCLHWLSRVRNGRFVHEECKYSKHFGNVFDFVFQAYQISISNFTRNSLFRQFALQDLADLFRFNIMVFHKMSRHNDDNFKITINEPSRAAAHDSAVPLNGGHAKTNEYIYILNDEFDSVKYKWLMPSKFRLLFNERFLTPSFRISEVAHHRHSSKRRTREHHHHNHHQQPQQQQHLGPSRHFLRANSLYTQHVFVINSSEISKCFDPVSSQNVNLMLFVVFLREAPVQTLMYKHDLPFGEILARNDPAHTVRCFNNVWGKPHFNLNELLSLAHDQSASQKVGHLEESPADEQNIFVLPDSPPPPPPQQQSPVLSLERAGESLGYDESGASFLAKRKRTLDDDIPFRSLKNAAGFEFDGSFPPGLFPVMPRPTEQPGGTWFDNNIKNRRFLRQFSSLRPQQSQKQTMPSEFSSPLDLCMIQAVNQAVHGHDRQVAASQGPNEPMNLATSRRKKSFVNRVISGELNLARSQKPTLCSLNSCLSSLLALRNKPNPSYSSSIESIILDQVSTLTSPSPK